MNNVNEWQPILLNKKIYIEEVIYKIHESFNHNFTNDFSRIDDPSLMYGRLGLALFYNYAYTTLGNEVYYEEFSGHLLEAFDLFPKKTNPTLNLGNGYTGLAWAIQYLINTEAIDSNEDIIENFYETLKVFSDSCFKIKDYDIMLGGLGFGVFLLERLEKKDRDNLFAIVQHMDEISLKDHDQIYWEQIINDGENRINLGIAHGLPGILFFLSKCYINNINIKTCKRLLNRGCEYLMMQQLKDKESCYSFSIQNGQQQGITPLRWCYGDLGVGMALLLIGINTNNSTYYDAGLKIGLKCTDRIAEIKSMPDVHICHGIAGVAHIFNRFFQYTKDMRFKQAACNAFEESFSRILDYKHYNTFTADKGDSGLIVMNGLMEGTAGIGMTFLAAITDVQPKWDKVFLLS